MEIEPVSKKINNSQITSYIRYAAQLVPVGGFYSVHCLCDIKRIDETRLSVNTVYLAPQQEDKIWKQNRLVLRLKSVLIVNSDAAVIICQIDVVTVESQQEVDHASLRHFGSFANEDACKALIWPVAHFISTVAL